MVARYPGAALLGWPWGLLDRRRRLGARPNPWLVLASPTVRGTAGRRLAALGNGRAYARMPAGACPYAVRAAAPNHPRAWLDP